MDHDVLIEIRTDIKYLVREFANHKVDDNTRFTEIKKGLDFTNRAIWMALGAGTIVTFFIRLLVK